MIFIYALVDPKTWDVRYVGKTNNPSVRLRDHCKCREQYHKDRWIRSLLAHRLKPGMVILSRIDDESDWQFWEKFWINIFKPQLTNLAPGGEGGGRLGAHLSAETKAKISASKMGRPIGPFSDETRRRMSLARMGKGHRHTDESKKKMSLARTGTKRSSETRARMRQAQIGKRLSLETRIKIGIASRSRRAGARMNAIKWGKGIQCLRP